MLKKLWSDPVWSKVISGAILAALLAVAKYAFNLSLLKLILAGAAFLLILAALWYWTRLQKRWKLRAELEVSIDRDFSHVAIISLRVFNPGSKPVALAAVEFVTREHWDMPDPLRMGTTDLVVNYFARGTPYTTISDEKGSVATKALGATLEPRDSFRVSFRLVTDRAEGYGIGLFPFHLSAELLHGRPNNRLALPDFIVSLHAFTNLSMTTFDKPIFPTFKPSTIQRDANAVLSRVQQGALCAPEILAILKKTARVNL